MKKPIHTIAFGQAAVHRVISELLLRGITPFQPTADLCGVDLLTDSGLRLQVKATRVMAPRGHGRSPSYHFELRCTRPNGLHKLTRFKRTFSEQCDFVILWGADEDRYWIVPSAILDRCGSVRMTPVQRWKDVDTEAVRADRADGLSYGQLAKRHGVSVQVVWDRVNREKQQSGNVARLVRQHENRWDLLTGYAQTLEEANKAVCVAPTKNQEK